MKKNQTIAILLLSALMSQNALADGRSAAHNFFSNLAKAKKSISVNESNTLAVPTLVRGMYALTTQQGGFVGAINEAGTLYGDSRGFNLLSESGAAIRPLNPNELAELRAEVLDAVDYDKMIRIQYGDGGGRRIVMFSAIDCPVCKALEDSMKELSGAMNTTMYLAPSSLQTISSGGSQKWQVVSRLWCAEEGGAAWKAYWVNRTIPQARQCDFAEPRTAEAASFHLWTIFTGAGVKGNGVPTMVREDGEIVRRGAQLDIGWATAALGPAGFPPKKPQSSRWLGANTNAGLPVQPLDSVTPMSTSSYQPKSVSMKAVLGNLFGK